MKTNNESGHEQNVTNLELILTIISTVGEAYNPSKSTITIPGLTEILKKGKLEIVAVNKAEIDYKNALAARLNVFEGFYNYVTRIINALELTDIAAPSLAQAKALVRDLRGKRAVKKLTDEEVAAEKEKGNIINQVTVHNASFISKIENLSKLVVFIESIPDYAPNETDLKLESIKTRLEDLKAANAAFVAADAALGAARLSRNEVLYGENTGLIDTALDVKLYTKSLFGANSPQYKQISSIAFKRLN